MIEKNHLNNIEIKSNPQSVNLYTSSETLQAIEIIIPRMPSVAEEFQWD